MDLTRSRYVWTALVAVAVLVAALLAVGTSPHRLFQSEAKLARSSEARKRVSPRKSANRALKIARKADGVAKKANKRSQEALAAALAPVISQGITDETITAADIAPDAVESDEIAAGAVGGSEIADGMVGSLEIADDAVGTSEIADDAVTGSEIADGAVGISELAVDAVAGGVSGAVLDESLTAADIATDAVTSLELADDAVDAAAIQTNAVDSSEVSDDAIASGEILDNAITSADILDGTIASADISQSVWSGSVHQAGTSPPAASSSNNGFLYFDTDDSGGTLYRSNGSSWVKVGAGVNQVGTSLTMTFGGQWDDMPAELTEFDGSAGYRTQYDLTDATEVRVVVNVETAGSTDSKIRAQYSTDGSTWNYLDDSSEPSIGVDASGLRVSPWASLASSAKADVYLRIVGLDGDGAADPIFSRIDIQVR